MEWDGGEGTQVACPLTVRRQALGLWERLVGLVGAVAAEVKEGEKEGEAVREVESAPQAVFKIGLEMEPLLLPLLMPSPPPAAAAAAGDDGGLAVAEEERRVARERCFSGFLEGASAGVLAHAAAAAMPVSVLRAVIARTVAGQGDYGAAKLAQMPVQARTPPAERSAVLLHFAAINPRMDVASLEEILRMAPAALTVRANDGRFPLHMALSGDLLDSAPIYSLVQATADLWPTLEQGSRSRSPLHVLLQRGRPPTLSLSLLADMAETVPEWTAADPVSGATALHCAACNPATAAVDGLWEWVCAMDRNAACAQDSQGCTPLHELARNRGFFGATALAAVRSLLDMSENRAAVIHATFGRRYPLHDACNNPNTSAEVLEALLRPLPPSANVGKQFEPCATTLLQQCRHLTPRMIDVLVAVCPPGALGLDARPGSTPAGTRIRTQLLENREHLLACACQNPTLQLDALQHILTEIQPGGASQQCPVSNELPLHLLLENHATLPLELVTALLDAYPEALTTRAALGQLPLHSAARNPALRVPVLHVLLERYPQAAGAGRVAPLGCMLHNCSPLPPLPVVEALVCAQLQVAGDDDGLRTHGGFVLHHAAGNPSMTVPIFKTLLRAFPLSTRVRAPSGTLPIECLTDHMPSDTRVQLAALLLGLTNDDQDGDASRKIPAPTMTGGKPYIPADPSLCQPDPNSQLSVQGRLRVGVHVALRGAEAAWKFQSAAGAHNVRQHRATFASALSCGHLGLLPQLVSNHTRVEIVLAHATVALNNDHCDAARLALELCAAQLNDAAADPVFAAARTGIMAAAFRHEPPALWFRDWVAARALRATPGVRDTQPHAELCAWVQVGTRLCTVKSMIAAYPAETLPSTLRMDLEKSAMTCCNTDQFQWLLDQGYIFATPMHMPYPEAVNMAVRTGSLAMIEYLHAMPEFRGVMRGSLMMSTAVSVAKHHGIGMLRFLSTHSLKMRASMTEMHVALRNRDLPCLRFLRRGWGIDCPPNAFRTAFRANDWELATVLLLECGAEPTPYDILAALQARNDDNGADDSGGVPTGDSFLHIVFQHVSDLVLQRALQLADTDAARLSQAIQESGRVLGDTEGGVTV